jgi:soluble lytic murein transglycosylase
MVASVSFDDHIRKALDRALTGVRGHLEADLRAFAQDLARAAAEERHRAVKEAADAVTADVRRQAQTQLAHLREAAQKHTDELRKANEAQVNELKRTLDEARRSAAAETAEARRIADIRLGELKKTTDQRIAELTEEIEHIRRTAAVHAEEIVVSQLAVAAAENERKLAEALERARTDTHQDVLAQAARFADAVRALDEARALGDVLDTLTEGAAREVDRAAVLLVKGDRLHGWRLAGFDASAGAARSIDLSLEEAELPGAVVRTGVAVSRPAVEPGPSSARQPALPPFAQDAGTRHALALPITVGGAVVAVLYADAPRLDTPSASSRWPAILDVLVRHASRVLEAMTVQQAAGLSLPRPAARGSHASMPGPLEQSTGGGDEDAARRYARLLLSEIRMYNEPLVDAGRRSRDLLSRLSGEIARAPAVRSPSPLYGQRPIGLLRSGARANAGRRGPFAARERTVKCVYASLALVVMSVAVAWGDGAADSGPRLTTTAHPPLPRHESEYWLVPDPAAVPKRGKQAAETAAQRFARGAKLVAAGDFAAGLPLVTGANLASTPLAPYGVYYSAVALHGLKRSSEADDVLTTLSKADLKGYLDEVVPLRLAEVALARGDARRAAEILDDLSDEKLLAPEEILTRLGFAEEAAGNRTKALDAYRRVYYGYPLALQAVDAELGIERLETPALQAPDRFKQELARAERLFTARRWAQARAAFVPLARVARGDEKELVALRIAECDYYLNRHRAARAALRPYLDDISREAEARFFHLTATRSLGDHDMYVTLARRLVADHPGSSWAEETLNNLASHHITLDQDADADAVFRELVRRFPKSRYGERAAWKIGWWAYKNDQFGEAAERFETAAAVYPRSDYRPSWLYWSGRARDRIGDVAWANARYRLAASDYLNSYYGRLASEILSSRGEAPVQPIVTIEPAASEGPEPLIPTDATIRTLVSLELHDDALKEVQYAQQVWGDSPALQATIAWIRHARGLAPKAADRFADVRGAITIMRRAYPQFLAAGGESLPPDVLRVIYPLDYWPLIKKYSDAHDLDPYLMTALVAQESTFTPDIRSSANAVGLMQLIPGTARTVARQLGIRRFTTRMLTQPETNVRLGMKYFKDMMDKFGGAHYALAGYNAGPHRVVRWKAERPGLEQDEFIDDIPFQETQNYVKRILGTAEDYRRLYGGGILSTTPATH